MRSFLIVLYNVVFAKINIRAICVCALAEILLRNLDVLTNEEGVLTLMQEVVPELVGKISKILICRDPLTSTSRGICYLTFDNLVDSMNTFNALKAIDPALTIGNREGKAGADQYFNFGEHVCAELTRILSLHIIQLS